MAATYPPPTLASLLSEGDRGNRNQHDRQRGIHVEFAEQIAIALAAPQLVCRRRFWHTAVHTPDDWDGADGRPLDRAEPPPGS